MICCYKNNLKIITITNFKNIFVLKLHNITGKKIFLKKFELLNNEYRIHE